MKKLLLIGMLMLLTVAAVAAHNDGPCNDNGEPGNSDYAQHHIKPLAQQQGLGADGHKPGVHQGFSVCLT